MNNNSISCGGKGFSSLGVRNLAGLDERIVRITIEIVLVGKGSVVNERLVADLADKAVGMESLVADFQALLQLCICDDFLVALSA